jgi:hypothetical protein
MDITINKKDFTFNKVSIWISEEYNKLMNMAYDSLYLSDETAEITAEYEDKIKNSLDENEKKLFRKKQQIRLKEKVKEARDHTQAMFDKRMEILQELVELNGYDYDDTFWRRKAGVEDINDIMVEVLGKGSKKK